MLITSTSNPLVKRIRALRRRKERAAQGAFFVDGIQAVWHALDHGAAIDTLVVAPDLLTSDGANRRIDAAVADGVAIARVGAEVYTALSDRDHPSGVGAIVATAERSLQDLTVDDVGVVVAVEEIGGPGNLGTIVRAADGAGASAVVVVGSGADFYDPAAVKASMGAIFTVPVCRAPDVDELFDWARASGLSIVTTSARASVAHTEAPYRLPALLMLGSEGEGLSEEVLARGDVQVRIPMRGAVSSLNVAVAAGILLYEIRRVTSS